MPKDCPYDAGVIEGTRDPEQSRALLAEGANDDEEEEEDGTRPAASIPQSSLSRSASNDRPRTPRTVSRVRFEIEERPSSEHLPDEQAPSPGNEENLLEVEDYLSRDNVGNRRGNTGQRAPLLTNIEAPSVTVAVDLDLDAEGLLESARPKSGTM